ncbi:hypothetical protein GUJ93_ZPchr0012g18990 [Zizania palustris]|uniref:Uncharacterized protein n=1 Tax=Zizania palustris TaxID=103762 RepID=A0A8J5WTV0_ZIZPA|nr:hypothetical protein GUJ93_ZPchr0012g18990 [Zizania palustris]
MGVFVVTKVSEDPVRPSGATPSETLPLAWVDRYPTHRGLVESVHVYHGRRRDDDNDGDAAVESALATVLEKTGELAERRRATTNTTKPPAAVVRGALADALVHYHPFAGRIVEDVPGRPAVLCSGEGVYFVEATANCSLADVNFLERPLLLSKEQLVPCPTPEQWAVEPHNSLAMIQVTTFTCGGFVIGLRTNHAVADGTGAAQFLNAVGDLARGLSEPRVRPAWARDSFPVPVKVTAPAQKVAASSVVEIVGMVREAKRRMADECLSWAEGRTAGRDPFQMTFNYESVYVSDWSKLGFSDVDYGYGTPVTAGPLVNCDLIASVSVMKAPAPLAGSRLLASCVTTEHADDFARRMREDLV